MACTSQVLKGLANDCLGSKGGIKEAFIATYDKVSGVTLSGDVITGISGDTSFLPFYFKKNTGNFTSTLNVDAANGVSYVSTEINLTFLRMETTKRLEMNALALGDMAVVVVDSNDVAWYFGYDNAVTATAGTGETGTQPTDGNKYTIQLTDESNLFPYEVSASVVAKLRQNKVTA